MIHFKKTLPAHLFIEMCYRKKNKQELIYEQKLNRKKFKLLSESYGVFDGCYELAVDIYHRTIEEAMRQNYDFVYEPSNCDFIEKIIIYVQDDEVSGYLSQESKIINGKFNPLSIYVGISVINEQDVISSIMHELTHAYEDYNRQKKGAKSIDQKSNDIGYYKNTVDMGLSENYYVKSVSKVIFYFTNFERNAMFSQFESELRSCGRTFKNIKEVLNFIKQTDLYKRMLGVYNMAQKLCSISDDNSRAQFKILTIVDSLSNYKFNTYNQFVKWLSNQMYKHQRKLNEIISKTAAKYLDMQDQYTPYSYYF